MQNSTITKRKKEMLSFSRRQMHSFAIMLVTFSSMLTQNVKAQAPDWEWAKGISSISESAIDNKCVATDTSNNLFVTAAFLKDSIKFGATILINAGEVDVFIAKYSSIGSVLWAKSIGGAGSEKVQSITTDANGNAYIVGSFGGSALQIGSTTLTNAGDEDIYIVKFDANGNVLWAKGAGGNSVDDANSIAIDDSGNVFIGGGFGNYYGSSSIAFDSITLNNSGLHDIFIAKYDSNGNILWAKVSGGADYDYGKSVATDKTGNVFLTGYFEGLITLGTTNLTSSGSIDVFLAKYDPNGNVIWAKSAGRGSEDGGRGIATDTNGNVFLVGNFYSRSIKFGSTILSNTGTFDFFIAKYDPNGKVLWAKSAGGNSQETVNSISVDKSGNAYISGLFDGNSFDIGTTTLINAGYNDVFIAKYDASGNALWAKSVGGVGGDYPSGVALDTDGNLFVAGWFEGGAIKLDALTLSNNSNFFIAKLAAHKLANPRNCSEILKQDSAAPSGVYMIDPDGSGPLPSMSCNCDMVTDGGGWMLVLNYNRLSGTDPALNVFTNALPLQNNTAPGFDESNTAYWGHAGNALMSAIPYNEIRFYGVTTNHNRVMNFKSNDLGTVYYFKTGIGNAHGLQSNFMALSGHNANLPASIDGYFYNEGDYAMTQAPFYTNSTYHWLIKLNNGDCGGANRWEVDDYCASLAPSTFHQIWVRQSGMDSCSSITCTIDPKIHMVNVANVTNASCNDGKIKVNLDGTFQFFPHLELYNTANVLVQSVTLPQGSTFYRFKNLVPGHYTVKVFDDKCCETVLVANVKCAPPATGISTTNVTATSVQFNWYVVNCAVGYRIHYREQGSTAWWTTIGVNTNVGLKTVFGLSPSTTYEWQVATKCVGFPAFDNMEDSPLQYFSTPALRIGETATTASLVDISLYPNPATHTLTVSFQNGNAIAKLKVLNTLGQVVIDKQLQGADGIFEDQLDVSKLNNGIYFLLIETASETGYTRFVKN